LVIGHWSLALGIGYWSLGIGHWVLVIGHLPGSVHGIELNPPSGDQMTNGKWKMTNDKWNHLGFASLMPPCID
jgi:hypothetical protein